jgi:hypothetical protein
MWTPELTPQGWIVVDEDGQPYEQRGAVQAGFTEEWAQALADRLNGES